MAEQIKDGTGSAYLAKVDSDNRLHGLSKTETFSESLSKEGNSYNFNTGTIRLSGSSATSQLCYFKNTGDNDVVVYSITYLMGVSSGGTGSLNVRIYRNPTEGTIVTNGTPKAPINNHFGSSNIISGTALIGGNGFTVTKSDGVAYESLLYSSGLIYRITPSAIVIPKGASICIGVTTQAGNTGMDIQIAVNCYEDV